MNRGSLLAAVLVGVSVGPAWADALPPVWMRYKSVTIDLEIAESLRDYAVFRTSYHRYVGPPRKDGGSSVQSSVSVQEVPLDSDRRVRVTGDRSSHFDLFAVPRAALDRYPDHNQLIAAIARKEVPGAARFDLDSLISNNGRIDFGSGNEKPDIVIRLRVEPSGDDVVFSRVTGQATPPEPGGSPPTDGGESSESRVRWLVAGAATAVAAGGTGLWLASRLRRRRPETSPS